MRRQQATGNGQQATGNGQQATFTWFLPFHFPLSTFYFLLKRLCLSVSLLTLFAAPAAAQFGASPGFVIQLIGMVQVEPGPNVLTLDVKDTEIRFQLQDLESTLQDFSAPRFLSDIRHRSPNLYIRGSEDLLDLLLKEKPSKRVLKLSGVYYSEPRRLLLNKISPVQDSQKPQF
jgi:hypothetical protein